MSFDLATLLRQFTNGAADEPQSAQDQFHQMAAGAPADLLTEGLAAMFRSDQTPPFGQMAGQLFGNAAPDQQAGMLNQLIGGMGPGLLSSLIGGAGGTGLAAAVSQLSRTGGSVSPEQAAKLTPDEVGQLASHAEQQEPGIIDRMSSFYAEHPGLVKTVGGAALSIALARMAQRQPA